MSYQKSNAKCWTSLLELNPKIRIPCEHLLEFSPLFALSLKVISANTWKNLYSLISIRIYYQMEEPVALAYSLCFKKISSQTKFLFLLTTLLLVWIKESNKLKQLSFNSRRNSLFLDKLECPKSLQPIIIKGRK